MEEIIRSLLPGEIHTFIAKSLRIEVMNYGGLYDAYIISPVTGMVKRGVQSVSLDFCIGYVKGIDDAL